MAITMEELKRKARAYDEAIKRAKEIVNNQNASSVWKDWLRNTFPELKESKGEEIRKNIISYLHNEKKVKRYISDIEFDKWIAWLEKQGEPIDKIKPKFHKGKWVVWQDKCYKVNCNGCGYELIDQNGLSTSLEYGTIDENAHLWTIADAKEGDVLAFDNIIVMFKDLYKKFAFHSYGYIEYEEFCISKDNISNCWEGKGFHPATKAQRDTLERAMTNAGWEFDFEKKELKKLTQQEVTKISDPVKDSDWSEEDEKMLNDAIIAVYAAAYYAYSDRQKIENWLKSLKQRIGG